MKKVTFGKLALEREYRNKLNALRKTIFDIIDYWLIPKFKKDFIGDANFKKETDKAVMFEVEFKNTAGDIKKYSIWIPKKLINNEGNPADWLWNKKIQEAKDYLTNGEQNTIIYWNVVDNPNFKTFKNEKQLQQERDTEIRRQENFAKTNIYREKLVRELKDKGYRAHMRMKTSTLESEARKRGIDFESLKNDNQNTKVKVDFQVGDFVDHKNFKDMKNMQVVEISEDILTVLHNNSKINVKKEQVNLGLKLDPYSENDSFNERLQKVRDNILKISDFEAKKIVENQINQLIGNINSNFKNGFSINLTKLDFDKQGMETIELMIGNNINLIKTIPSEILESLDSLIYNSSFGADNHSLEKGLATIKRISKNRVKTIARDQTAKALNAIASVRAQQNGFEYYEWITAQDERVSHGYGGHRQLQGKIFRYDAPEAIIDTYGNKGHPAQRVNCRCIAAPIFLDSNEKLEKVNIGYVIKKI